ncbi:MarC family protein [Magnetospirillum sp. UT-4]|uniref:MarC family protein n=1 Tax=Magnetospirillum sp. UT-4 TaxID=2681467 RepID=UPI0020C39FAF|nr:MarC family protein [Magnetospirillum sp. UT-4]
MIIEAAVTAFITFFVILDPPGTAAVFAAMTRNVADHHRRHMARRATLLAAIMLFAFAFIGEGLLRILGISLPAFRVAGGVLLFLLAADMVFARQSGLRSTTPVEDAETAAREDITVFPLAFPLIAGPGAMTSVVLMMGAAAGDYQRQAVVLAMLAVVMALLLGMLLAAGRVLRVLGLTGAHVVGRVLGIILAALAAQFVIDGLKGALPGLVG